jgi:hypothetical protein
MQNDGYVRAMLTVIALALLVLIAIEAGLVGGPAGGDVGRYTFGPVRFGPLGNFVLRFDTATGRLDRVRFPAPDVVWEEVGVVPDGRTAKPDPLRAELPAEPAAKRPGIQIQVPPGGAPPAGNAP